MSLGYPNQNGGRTTDAALFHALGNVFKGTWVSGFKVRQSSPLGMSVRVGGESSTPDDLLVRDGSGATFPVCNLSSQPVVATVATANSANPRIDSVVVYIDSAVAANHTAANNQNRTKVAVVSGTPATSPSAPSASQIKSVVGSNSPYVVLADIRVNRAVTSISDTNITDRREAVRLNHAPVISDSAQLANDIVLSRHIKAADIAPYSSNGATQQTSGGLLIQSGWVSFLGRGGKTQDVTVVFPRPFKQCLAVVPVLIGYTFSSPSSPQSFDQRIGAGTNIECGQFTNTGTTIKASTSGIFGGAHHGISWIAIGTI